MPLLSAILAATVGFAIPWRFGWEHAGRTTWVGAGEATLVCAVAVACLLAPHHVLASARATVRRYALTIPSILIVAIALGHAAMTPAGDGGGPLPALATAWAVLAGAALARLDREALLDGIRWGTWSSGLAGIAFLVVRPELVLEHKYFAAFTGTKNAFAFLVAVSMLAAIERTHAGRGGRLMAILELGVGAGFLYFANARAAAAAIGAAMLVGRGGGRKIAAARGLVALAAAVFVSGAAVPWDRIHFAWAIAAHADAIPAFGFGPGFGYGLDTALKLLLELGPVGFVALSALAIGALRRDGVTPWLVLVAVFAAAHDLARWPIFWMLWWRSRPRDDWERD